MGSRVANLNNRSDKIKVILETKDPTCNALLLIRLLGKKMLNIDRKVIHKQRDSQIGDTKIQTDI